MKTKEKIEEYLKEDIIGKLYENNLYLSEILPQEKEYDGVTRKIVEISNRILKQIEEKNKKDLIEYMEYVNIKQGIEAKHQFELGFKVAIQLILEGLA